MYSLHQLRTIEGWRVAFEAYVAVENSPEEWLRQARTLVLGHALTEVVKADIDLDQIASLQTEIRAELANTTDTF